MRAHRCQHTIFPLPVLSITLRANKELWRPLLNLYGFCLEQDMMLQRRTLCDHIEDIYSMARLAMKTRPSYLLDIWIWRRMTYWIGQYVSKMILCTDQVQWHWREHTVTTVTIMSNQPIALQPFPQPWGNCSGSGRIHEHSWCTPMQNKCPSEMM